MVIQNNVRSTDGSSGHFFIQNLFGMANEQIILNLIITDNLFVVGHVNFGMIRNYKSHFLFFIFLRRYQPGDYKV